MRINGQNIDLYDHDPNERNLPATEDPWMGCTVMPAAATNRLLEAAGSDCRLALFWPGGNDGISVLAPRALLEAIGKLARNVRPVIS